MEIIKPYLGILSIIFILSYWGALSVLLYHLKRYGSGRIITKAFYAILIVSIVLTSIAIFFYTKI